jgi:hypothetical protein
MFAVKGDDFLRSILMGDESWLHRLDPETK